MPDEFEAPETEKAESRHERLVGLIIAAIAVVLAIVTHLGNEANNEKIVAHVDASDQFSFYQAKKLHRSQLEVAVDQIKLEYDRLSAPAQAEADKHLASYDAEIKHLEDDDKEIKAKADELLLEAHHLEAKATYIELGEIALQISIVLCSITILTEQNLFVKMGVVAALAGVFFAVWAFL